MANFNLVIDSKFKPFSYEEMLAPLIASTQAHQALEDQYAELEANASVWDKLKDSELDKVTYNRYKDYMGEVVDSANILTTKGLTLDAKRKALAAKRDYRKIVVPIEEAYARRAKQMEEQNKGRAAGLVYNTLAQDTSLEDYIHNDTLQHQFADSNAGYKRVHDAAAALKNELQDFKTSGRIDTFTKVLMQRNGYTRETANQAINDINAALRGEENLRGRGILQDILATEMETSGVSSWGNKAAQMDYLNRISPAIYNAVGTTTYKPYADKAAELAAKKAMDTPQGPSHLPLNPQVLRSARELTKQGKNINDFKQYFTIDKKGNPSLTKAGLEEYNKTYYSPGQSMYSVAGVTPILNGNTGTISPFRRFVDEELKASNLFNSKGEILGPSRLANKFAEYVNKYEGGSYDVNREMEYAIDLTDTQGTRVADVISSSTTGEDISEVDYSYEKGFESTDRKIKKIKGEDASEPSFEGARVVRMLPSSRGITAQVRLKNGEDIRVNIPRGVNKNAYDNAVRYATNAELLTNISNPNINIYKPLLKRNPNTGKEELVIDNGKVKFTNEPLSYNDIYKLRELAAQYYDMMTIETNNLVRPTDTKTQTIPQIPNM